MKNRNDITTSDKQSFTTTFAKRLKKARKAKYHTQDDFAEAISYSKDSVSKWESGTTQPCYESLCMICKKLEIDVDYLFGFYDEKSYDIRKIKEITGLSEKAIEMLKEKTLTKTISFLLEDSDFVKALLTLNSIAFLLSINSEETLNNANDPNIDILRQINYMYSLKFNAQRYMANAVDNFIDHIETDLEYPETMKQKNNDFFALLNRLPKT